MVKYQRLLNGSAFVLPAILLALASVFYIGVNTARAATDTCTWTGDGGNAEVTNGGNWTGCDNSGVPESGDSLIFPDGPANKTVLLDIYNTYESITFSGSDYTINAAGSESLAPTVELIISGDNNTFNSGVRYLNPTENIRFEHSGTGTVFAESIVVQTPDPPAVEFTLQIDSDVSVPNFAHAGDPEPLDIVRKTGVGTLTISGSFVTGLTADTIEISGGIWKCDDWNCLGDEANHIIVTTPEDAEEDMVMLQLNDPSGSQNVENPITLDEGGIHVSSSATLTGNLDFSGLGGLISVDEGQAFAVDGDVDIAEGQAQYQNGDGDISLNGTVSGDGGVHITNAHTFIAGNNTYTGDTAIEEGSSVEVQHNNALGTTGGDTTINDGGTLIPTDGLNIPENITVIHDGIDPSGLGALYVPSGGGPVSAEFSGTITLDGDSTLIRLDDDSTLTLSGVIEGTGDLVINEGEGDDLDTAVNISGVSPNTLDGTMTILGTSVNFNKDGSASGDVYITALENRDASVTVAGDVSDAIPDDAPVTLADASAGVAVASLTFEADETIGGLRGEGTVDATGVTLTLDVSRDSTYSGMLTVDTLIKTGESTQTIDNDVNASVIEINEGDFVINGSTTASITVAEDSIFRGINETGNLDVLGTLAPGQSPGIITINGDLDLTDGTLEAEIEGVVAGSQYDQTIVTGTATLDNTKLKLEMNFTPTNGDVFTFLRAETINGEFEHVPDGLTVEVDGFTIRANYNLSDTGEDTFTLTFLDGGLPNTGLQQQSMLPYVVALTIGTMLLLWQIKSVRRHNK